MSVVEKPPTLAQSVTVFYKHHIGSYSKVTNILNEALDILPSGPKKTFGIFYDNPDVGFQILKLTLHGALLQVVSPDRCQAAIGCVFSGKLPAFVPPHPTFTSVDGKELYDSNFATQLTRWGFERMVIPAVQRAVHTRQRFSGIFSIWHLTRHVYPKINEFVKVASCIMC